jgi:hypothetical protein
VTGVAAKDAPPAHARRNALALYGEIFVCWGILTYHSDSCVERIRILPWHPDFVASSGPTCCQLRFGMASRCLTPQRLRIPLAGSFRLPSLSILLNSRRDEWQQSQPSYPPSPAQAQD